ncbi:hypothetical protein ABZT17_35000 [Streptomyces sp. NPDC005648]|uniref:hypothetical protein n=1 Tax=Streptomyces sp. NPDC005648 TaxID=3157044 RepID=UPI0033A101A7
MPFSSEFPEQPGEDLAAHILTVKKFSAFVPVSAEHLLDAGIPLPPGMEPPPAPEPLPRRIRWRMARADFIERLRHRVGFWIAGYEPDDEDW